MANEEELNGQETQQVEPVHTEQVAPPAAATEVRQPQAHSGQQKSGQGHRQAPNPTARLRELLSVPERFRTDAQWDEIIEIEIALGPRKSPPPARASQSQFRNHEPRGHEARSERERPEKKAGGNVNKHLRKRHKPGGNKPQGGGGQGGSNQGGSNQGGQNQGGQNQGGPAQA